ncbi:hypothetical protein FRY74_06360 [Vicingus serpentipes]|uniref:Nuclear transport factor 2 family protein n=1 Tax=Vicingus serpentipes TaxID=1926625 RepID=A0A5C6RXV3_9FLAO|nr:hypothetical protein [Vicingus serpentipes]TXB66192.1 hypothetical protein FRY74_06360 [Vicingus serpentipes]
METLIKLKVNQELEGIHDNIIEEAFIDACINLDASLFEPLINENQYFQDLDKYRFLQSLKNTFEDVKLKGVLQTTIKPGKCMGCKYGKANLQFFGNRSKPEFSYIINKENNLIEDIFICNMSSGIFTDKLKSL